MEEGGERRLKAAVASEVAAAAEAAAAAEDLPRPLLPLLLFLLQRLVPAAALPSPRAAGLLRFDLVFDFKRERKRGRGENEVSLSLDDDLKKESSQIQSHRSAAPRCTQPRTEGARRCRRPAATAARARRAGRGSAGREEERKRPK